MNTGNINYYWESGFKVFTKDYHLKRGYCCKSGCRHCPYDDKAKVPDEMATLTPLDENSVPNESMNGENRGKC